MAFDFSGPKDDFDLSVTGGAEIRPVQLQLKSRKREEKHQEREY